MQPKIHIKPFQLIAMGMLAVLIERDWTNSPADFVIILLLTLGIADSIAQYDSGWYKVIVWLIMGFLLTFNFYLRQTSFLIIIGSIIITILLSMYNLGDAIEKGRIKPLNK